MIKSNYCKICIISIMIILLFIGNFFVNTTKVFAFNQKIGNGSIDYQTSAKACMLMDCDSKRVFYQKNQDTKLAMASTTKIITAITAIENCKNLDTPIKVDDRAIGVNGSSIYLKKGEELTIRELLYGLMLRSGNDAATAIAYNIGGSIDGFCELMNLTAKKIGVKNSKFSNPHGLDCEGHYTTAKDLAIITSYALNNPVFLEIVKTKSIKISGMDNDRYLFNKNKLLNNLEGCIGVKTGFTDNAGRCLVSACERNGFRVVCVVLNCGPMFEQSAEMIEKVYKKYQNIELLEPYHYISNISISNGEKSSIGIYSRKGLKLPLSNTEYSKINIVYDLPEILKAPIKSESVIGSVKIYYDKHLIFSEEIYTMESVKSLLIRDKLKEILDNWNM